MRFRLRKLPKNPLHLFIILITLAAAYWLQDRPKTTDKEGQVVAVLDGDTLEVMQDGKAVRVRLAEIDCPEKSQPYGNKAKQFTSSQAFGKIVTLKIVDKDRYSRLVAAVILPDGKSLNEELLRNGFAWWYRHYSKNKALGEIENNARRQKLGLWADANPEPPWEFRRKSKNEE